MVARVALRAGRARAVWLKEQAGLSVRKLKRTQRLSRVPVCRAAVRLALILRPRARTCERLRARTAELPPMLCEVRPRLRARHTCGVPAPRRDA